MTRPPIVITGPTASGKTALSIEVARRVEGEIISMDSRQLYRGMDIGTAKANAEQRSAVPHHGLDLVDPGERFSAGAWARRARQWIAEIQDRGRVPLLVGGTGFFLRALTHPIFTEPELDPDRRDRLVRVLEERDDEELLRWLQALDPESAERLARWGGRQRRLRALEIALLTGITLPEWHRRNPPEAEPLRARVFVLEMPRPRLFAAIDRRVDDMLREGLRDEVAGLLRAGYAAGDAGMNATGYAELIPALEGERPMEEAVQLVKTNTRAYAKRQTTWFRHQLPADATRLDATRPIPALADELVAHWRAGTEQGEGR